MPHELFRVLHDFSGVVHVVFRPRMRDVVTPCVFEIPKLLRGLRMKLYVFRFLSPFRKLLQLLNLAFDLVNDVLPVLKLYG